MVPRLAIVGDVHSRLPLLQRVLEEIRVQGADGILLVGDIACAREAARRAAGGGKTYAQRLAEVFSAVERLGLPYAWVPGNHDLPDVDHPRNIDGRVVELGGLRVGGLGGAGPARFGFPYEWSEEELRARDPLDCDLLLSHCPPAHCALDRTRHGKHVGSEAIRERCGSHRVLVCGHIHEAPSAEEIDGCLCLNAGGLGQPYGRAQLGWVEGLDHVWHQDLVDGRRQDLRRLHRADETPPQQVPR
jgi:Icc-related predicted phosphoesterase